MSIHTNWSRLYYSYCTVCRSSEPGGQCGVNVRDKYAMHESDGQCREY